MFFTVYYAEKGDKMLHHFQGKIDIGTGNGGIISQLKMQNEMKLTDESWISYQQGKGNEEYQKYMEDLTDMQNHVLLYLLQRRLLTQLLCSHFSLSPAVLVSPSHLFLPDCKSSANTAVHDSAYPSDLPYTSDILHCLFLADS